MRSFTSNHYAWQERPVRVHGTLSCTQPVIWEDERAAEVQTPAAFALSNQTVKFSKMMSPGGRVVCGRLSVPNRCESEPLTQARDSASATRRSTGPGYEIFLTTSAAIRLPT